MKKTNSLELQATISVVLICLILLMPITYILQIFGLIGSFPVGISEVVLVLGASILVIFDVMYLMLKENRHLRWFDILIILNVISLMISAFFAENTKIAFSGHGLSCEGLYTMLSYLVIGYSMSLVRDNKYLKYIYISSVVFGLIQVLMGLFESVIEWKPFMDLASNHEIFAMRRALGTVKNPNPYGSLMVLLAGLESGLTYGSKSIKNTVFHGVLAFLYIMCIILSGTRGAMLGYAVSALVFAIVVLVNGKRNELFLMTLKRLGIVVVIAVLAFTSVALFSNGTIKEVTNRTDTDLSKGNAGEDRLDIWRFSLETMFMDSPIIGKGLSNVDLTFFSVPETENEEDDVEVTIVNVHDAHNRYINLLATQGLIGLVVYLMLQITVFCRGIKKIKNGGFIENPMMLGMLMAMLGYMVADFFCIGMYSVVVCFYLLGGCIYKREEILNVK